MSNTNATLASELLSLANAFNSSDSAFQIGVGAGLKLAAKYVLEHTTSTDIPAPVCLTITRIRIDSYYAGTLVNYTYSGTNCDGKIACIKLIRDFSGLGLGDSKFAAENLPFLFERMPAGTHNELLFQLNRAEIKYTLIAD